MEKNYENPDASGCGDQTDLLITINALKIGRRAKEELVLCFLGNGVQRVSAANGGSGMQRIRGEGEALAHDLLVGIGRNGTFFG